MKITGLSLDSQLVILSQLPSHTLLNTVPLVCARWNQLQPHACLTRRTVKLIIHPNSQHSVTSPHFTLYPAQLDAPCAVALSATFPSVTHLVINHWNFSIDELDQQLYLLQSWTSTLVSLHLIDIHTRFATQVSPQFSAFFGRLLALLNQMPRLKRLAFTTVGRLPPSTDLSGILSRLVDVELNFCSSEHLLVPQVLQHCTPTLERLSLGTIRHFPAFLPLLTNPLISSKLVGLKMQNCDTTQLAITFDRCTNLRTLELDLPTLGLYAERMHLLTKLPRLTELKLVLEQSPLAPNDLLEPVLVPVPLPVLSSIRKLTIILWIYSLPSHEHLVQVTRLDEVFPQLQLIQLHWSSILCCQHCQTNGRHRNSCIDALLQPLARLETLQMARVRMRFLGDVSDWLPRLRSQSSLS